jgi:hypothetical protein
MEKGLYEFLVQEFEFIAENANDEEEVYTEEGIKKTLEWLDNNDLGLYQVIEDYLADAYQSVNE